MEQTKLEILQKSYDIEICEFISEHLRYDGIEIWTPAQYYENDDPNYTFVAYVDGKMAGVASIYFTHLDEDCELRFLSVSQQFRRMSVAKRLVDLVAECVKIRG